MKNGMLSQKTINFILLILLLGVVILMVYSNQYLKNAINAEQEAFDRMSVCQELGQTLADASDYLTEEVRKYVITNNREHMENYWDEVYTTKRRDTVIGQLQELQLLSEEVALLEAGKQHSDDLIYVEALAMKLETESLMQEVPEEVLIYAPEKTDETLSAEEKRVEAISLLFDDNYTKEKNLIHGYIADFQDMINERMNKELLKSQKATAKAMTLQITLQFISVLLVISSLLIVYRYMITPVLYYAKKLENNEEKELAPRGAKEIFLLGKAVRKMYDDMSFALQAKSQFLAVMSHEIRTPLHSMSGYTFLLKNTTLDQKQQEYVRYLSDATQNLLLLVNQILDYEKLENKKFQVETVGFYLEELKSSVERDFSVQCREKGIALFCEITTRDKERKMVYGDFAKLKQILTNLIGNAIKFTCEGSIRVVLELLTDEKGTILLMRVKDTGIGIKSEDFEKIFSSFEQADASVTRRFGGTGLGLPICKQMAELMGGEILVDSEYGKGTTFCVRIPVRLGDKVNDMMENEVSGEKTLLQEKEVIQRVYPDAHILFVEDNEVNRYMQKEIFQLFQLKVTLAENGKRAVELAVQEAFDLIITDIRMPEMDGYETAEKIWATQKNKNTVIVALTADAQPEVYKKVIACGMSDVLTKPIQIKKLQELLYTYLPDKAHLVEKTMYTMENDEGLQKEVLAFFYRNHDADFEKIETLCREEKREELASLLHMLKGVTGTVGAVAMQKLCEELEGNCKDITIVLADEKYVAKAKELRKMYFSSKQMYEQEKATHVSEKSEHMQMEHATWESLYQTFVLYIEEGNFEAVSLFEENKAAFKDFLGEEKTQRIAQLLSCFDYRTLLEDELREERE